MVLTREKNLFPMGKKRYSGLASAVDSVAARLFEGAVLGHLEVI